jgi:hypothetical protein
MGAAMRTSAGRGGNRSAQHVPERARFLMDWTRRYDEPFLLVRVPVAWGTATGAASGAGGGRRPPTLQIEAQRVTEALRSTDVCWVDAEHVYVMVLRGTERDAVVLGERLRLRFPGVIQAGGLATAQFPHDGLTLPALLRVLGTANSRAEPQGVTA